ncbi:unnamed protein product, partial [Symbiodinium sp. KB8]
MSNPAASPAAESEGSAEPVSAAPTPTSAAVTSTSTGAKELCWHFCRPDVKSKVLQHAPTAATSADTLTLSPRTGSKATAAPAAHPKDLEYAAPSKVVFVRNLPLDIDESELLDLAKPYGGARAVLLLQRKGQAFVELRSTASAASMKQGLEDSPVEIRGWRAIVSFSKRDRITPPPKVDVSKALAAAAGGHSADSVAGTTGTVPRVSRVLLVTIMNVVYPVTVDILSQVFASYGQLEKVVVFLRDPNVAGLVQMPNLETAIAAKEALDGQCIYTNCNKMRIQFSKLDSVSVRYNNDKSRDFTDDSLPPGPPGALTEEEATGPLDHMQPHYGMHGVHEDMHGPYDAPLPHGGPHEAYGAAPPPPSQQ